MKKLKLSNGMYSLLDDQDYLWASEYRWMGRPYHSGWRVCREESRTGKTIYLHREITKAPTGLEVDHVDGNGLNNTRTNLRVCTHSENGKNRRVNQNSKSGYKGVVWREHAGKWQANITVDKKRIYLGYHDTPEQAAQAYDLASKQYHGDFAHLNFLGRTK